MKIRRIFIALIALHTAVVSTGAAFEVELLNARKIWDKIDYIHANPVRRGLVAQPTDWEWSSARWYEGERDVELEMDASILF